jgi:DNA mismatch repair protein MutL
MSAESPPLPANSSSTRRIRCLSASVINKIAAGEVIERPASVVKELLENSVDAGATQIEVSIENGGLDAIRVTDNGSGIPYDDLQLAITSHATSKIESADDLFQVGTFGFRGEALASIAEISEFTLRTRTAEGDSGYEMFVRGGHTESVAPVGSPIGTTIRVDNLFFNTPVRRKFLRTAQTEAGHVTEAFTRVALAHPQCHLILRSGGKVTYDLPPCGDWQTRIHDFFGSEISSALIPIDSREGQVSLTGYVVDPSVSRSHNRLQYLFLNGRYIRDRSLQHALSEAYRGLLMTGRFPICFLRLNMPYDLVDVNVHPAKLEVRFQDGGRLYSQLLAALRNRFLTTDLTARAQLGGRGEVAPPIPSPFPASGSGRLTESPFSLGSSSTQQQHRIDFPTSPAPARDWLAPSPTSATNAAAHLAPALHPTPGLVPGLATGLGLGQVAADRTFEPAATALNVPLTPGAGIQADEFAFRPPTVSSRSDRALPDEQSPLDKSAETAPQRVTALQVANTYLVTETSEGMLVIDQHALHERILYEQFKAKISAGGLETQRLLVPTTVTLRPAEAVAVLEQADLLRRFGIIVEPFGGETVAIMGYPAILSRQDPAEMLRQLLEPLMTEGASPQTGTLLDELLNMMACKAAVKAGDRLSAEEIAALLEHRDLCHDSHHCPHGRPTVLVFSREELDRRFKRI